MGINTTPTNHKSFTFDGRSSREFGVYTTGEGVFNAPERAVEMISIPARNGEYALDLGHFENIEVTYRCGIVADNETDFAEAVSDFRNWLCSRRGYCRLQDEYNTDEFRMGVFKNVVNVEHDGLQTGEFDVTFDCKPQRWLTSGETATAVANNGTLSNPTLFDSEPLLAVKGYGTLLFNGYTVEVNPNNSPLGDVVLLDNLSALNITSKSFQFDGNLVNTGDDLRAFVDAFEYDFGISGSGHPITVTSQTVSDSNSLFHTATPSVVKTAPDYVRILGTTKFDGVTFSKGTSQTITNTVSGTVTAESEGTPSTISYTETQKIIYTSPTTIQIQIHGNVRGLTLIGDSTKTFSSGTTYIDCDIGECWTEISSAVVSLNHLIELGSDLPKLSPGTNTFTYDYTMTELKVTPRWWKV